MKAPVIVIGIGEMGSVFARGFLRLGHPVYPLTRSQDISELAGNIPEPALVLVAVGEGDVQAVLSGIPSDWDDRVALLQNELLPNDYQAFPEATVISVWFEKKKGQDSKVIIPSPAYGPHARLLEDALGSIDIPVRVLSSAEELLFELVVKNLYILTSNIAGLKTGGSVGELWAQHQDFAREVVTDIIAIQQALTGQTFDKEALIDAMVTAFEGDPDHQCMGRSAPARLARALKNSDQLGISVPTLRSLDGL